jgi:hypothetical protein
LILYVQHATLNCGPATRIDNEPLAGLLRCLEFSGPCIYYIGGGDRLLWNFHKRVYLSMI